MAEIGESNLNLDIPIAGAFAREPTADQEDQTDGGTNPLPHLNDKAVPADAEVSEVAPSIPTQDATQIPDAAPQSAPVKRLPNSVARGGEKVTVRPSAVRSASKAPASRKPRSTSLAKLKPTKVSTGTDAKLVVVQSTNFNSKDSVMDMQSADFTAQIKETAASFNEKAKEAFQKSAVAVDQLAGFSKGNAEAITEAGKILSKGLGELVTETVADCRTAFDVLTADAKELAEIRSPADFFKFQANLLGRNIGMALDYNAKNNEAVLNLAKEASAPLTKRLTLAANALQSVG